MVNPSTAKKLNKSNNNSFDCTVSEFRILSLNSACAASAESTFPKLVAGFSKLSLTILVIIDNWLPSLPQPVVKATNGKGNKAYKHKCLNFITILKISKYYLID